MYKYIAHIFIGLFILCSCTDTPVSDDYIAGALPYYLVSSSNELIYESAASTQTLFIKASQSWDFTGYNEWLTLEPRDGKGDADVKVSVSENFSADTNRTSIFYLNSLLEGWEYHKPLSVSQKTAAPFINLDAVQLSVRGSASIERITVESNTVWEAVCEDSWITPEYDNDRNYLDLHIQENCTGEERSTSIVLKGATTEIITVNQARATVETESQVLYFEQGAGTYLIEINSDTQWEATTRFDWVDFTPSSGPAGKSTLAISVTPNWDSSKRYSTIGLRNGDVGLFTFLIEQEGVRIDAAESIVFDALESTRNIDINSNITWEVLSKPDWLTLSNMSGSGRTTITATASNNSERTDRTGKIEIGRIGLTQRAEILVSQPGKHFAIDNEALNIDSHGGVMQLSLTTNDEWETGIEDEPEWLSISTHDGIGNKIIDLTAADNPSVSPRSAKAYIKPLDFARLDIIIRQEGRYLRVNSDGVQFFSKGGTSRAIIVDTDSEFDITCDSEWIQIKRVDNIFYVTADKNETGHIREANVNLKLTEVGLIGTMTLTLKVIQTAPGGHFEKDDFTHDNSWDETGNHKISLNIIGYKADDIWDNNSNNNLSIQITHYPADDDWDSDKVDER